MKFTRSQLEEFVSLEGISNLEVCKLLTELGFETKIVIDYLDEIKGLKLGKVVKVEKIPNKNKINYVQIENDKKIYDIVCGANNYKTGDFIVWAAPGSELFGVKISLKKFGNIESQGMMCSEAELGISEIDNDGILVINDFIDAKKINWNANPLKLIQLADCLFDIETMFSNLESKSVYSLALYLSKYLKSNNKFKKIKILEIKNEVSTVDNKPNSIFQTMNFEINITTNFNHFFWKNNNILSINAKDEVTFLIKYCEIIFGTKLILEENQKSNKKITIIVKNKNIMNDYSSQSYKHAFDYFLLLASKFNIMNNPKLVSYFFVPKKSEYFEVNINSISKKIGHRYDLKKLKLLLEDKDFIVNSLSGEQIKIICPPEQNFFNTSDLYEEIVRYTGINNIEAKPLNIVFNADNMSSFYKNEQKIKDFFLSWGFNEMKIQSLEKPTLKNLIKLNKNKEKNTLRPFLINSLLNKFLQNKEFIFSAGKVFFFKNKKPIEKTHLGAVSYGKFIIDPTNRDKLTSSKKSAFFMFQKILDIFHLDRSKIFLKISHQDSLFSKYLDSFDFKNDGVCKIEEYWYLDKFLFFVGEKEVFKSNKKTLVSFLEMDLSYLISLIRSEGTKIKIVKKINIKQNFQDFTLVFDDFFSPELLVKNQKNENFFINHNNYWIAKLKKLTKNIDRVELIKVFEEKTLTYRFWAKPDSANPNRNNKKLFLTIENKLKTLSDAKIK